MTALPRISYNPVENMFFFEGAITDIYTKVIDYAASGRE